MRAREWKHIGQNPNIGSLNFIVWNPKISIHLYAAFFSLFNIENMIFMSKLVQRIIKTISHIHLRHWWILCNIILYYTVHIYCKQSKWGGNKNTIQRILIKWKTQKKNVSLEIHIIWCYIRCRYILSHTMYHKA